MAFVCSFDSGRAEFLRSMRGPRLSERCLVSDAFSTFDACAVHLRIFGIASSELVASHGAAWSSCSLAGHLVVVTRDRSHRRGGKEG